jgi:hypothetical protein
MLSTATLSSGAYSYTFTPSALGSYTFYVSWPGNSQYNPVNSSTTIVTVTAVQLTTPTITLQSSATNVISGQTVTLSGAVSPSTSGTVTLSQSVNGSAYQQIATPSLASGAYSYQYTIAEAGTYKFQASFAGNSQYNPAQSSAVTVSSTQATTTTTTSTNYTWYIVGAVIVIIIIIIIAAYYMMSKPKAKATK